LATGKAERFSHRSIPIQQLLPAASQRSWNYKNVKNISPYYIGTLQIYTGFKSLSFQFFWVI
jgi:hypothetical protein